MPPTDNLKKLLPIITLSLLTLATVVFYNQMVKKGPQTLRSRAAEPENIRGLLSALNGTIKLPSFFGQLTSITAIGPLATQGHGDKEQFGRTIIPTILGTVSTYSGASSFDFSFLLPKTRGGFAPSLGLSYSSSSVDDAHAGNYEWKTHYSMPPSPVGMGFSLGGFGAVVRDTRGIKSKVYEDRFLLTLPSGAFELRWNDVKNRWVSVPNGFLKIDHEKAQGGHDEAGSPVNGKFNVIDGGAWNITTKDGTVYSFGDTNLAAKLQGDGQLIGSQYHNENNVEWTTGGSIANTFDVVELCKIDECVDQADGRKGKQGVSKLLTTRWLLNKVLDPNGRTIYFNYNVEQVKEFGTLGNLNFSTPTSYPSSVTWGQTDGGIESTQQFKVVFARDTRPDKGPYDEMRERIIKATVSVKKPDSSWEAARSYNFKYYNDGELGGLPTIAEKNFHPSLLKSIQESGRESGGSPTLPAVTFNYKTEQVPDYINKDENSASAIYLQSIDNGYGGKTSFTYASYQVPYKTRDNAGDLTEQGRWGSGRVRVTGRKVEDTITSKSYQETYEYKGGAYGFEETQGDSTREDADCYDSNKRRSTGCYPPTGMQFLGHSLVEVRKLDFDNSLLSHQKVYFYQSNTAPGCFEPHPAKGLTSSTEVYNGDASLPYATTTNTYAYRLNGQDYTSEDTNDPTNISHCSTDTRVNQPVFTYLKKTKNTVSENQSLTSPAAAPVKANMNTSTEYLTYDIAGNLTRSKSTNDTGDARYSYSYFINNIYDPDPSTVNLSNPSCSDDSGKNKCKWILNLPYLSYSSPPDSSPQGLCAPKNSDGTIPACQYGRTENYYNGDDHPLGGPIFARETYVVPIKKVVYKTADQKYVERYEADTNHPPNILKVYTPKPNLKTVTNEANGSNDLMLSTNNTYETTYNAFVTETDDVKGYQTKMDYDWVLQAPTAIHKQIDANGYAKSEMEYDAFGRVAKTYLSNPTAYDAVLDKSFPATINAYFDNTNNKGLAIRTLSLSKLDEKTNPYTPFYTASDVFYDGLGNMRQSQLLATAVEGDTKRVVSFSDYNGSGAVTKTYEPQAVGAVTGISNTSYLAPVPNFYGDEQNETLTKTQNGATVYDELGRVTSSQKYLDGNKATDAVSYAYAANAQQVTNPTGVKTVTVADGWGRSIGSMVTDTAGKHVDTVNTYDDTNYFLVDKPATTTYSTSDNTLGSVAATNTYDKSGMVMTTKDPSLGKYAFTYNVDGSKATETRYEFNNENNKVGQVTMTYDELGRVKSKVYDRDLYANRPAGAATDGKTISYEYDNGANALGKVTKVTDPTGWTTYGYDKGQRLTTTTKRIFDKQQTSQTTYNLLSQVTSSTIPVSNTPADRNTASMTYDQWGRLQTTDFNSYINILKDATYDKYGKPRRQQYVFGSGFPFVTDTNYDSLGRLYLFSFAKTSVPFLDEKYIYSSSPALSRIDTIQDRITQNKRQFYYDDFSQLTGAQDNSGNYASYSYDLFGRMKTKTEGARTLAFSQTSAYPFFAPKTTAVNGGQAHNITYDTKTGGVAGIYATGYTDQNGNLIYDEPGEAYSYNPEGQLVAMHQTTFWRPPTPTATPTPVVQVCGRADVMPTPTPNGIIDVFDILGVINGYPSKTGEAKYDVRFDIMPDSGPDGRINIADVQKVANLWGVVCSPPAGSAAGSSLLSAAGLMQGETVHTESNPTAPMSLTVQPSTKQVDINGEFTVDIVFNPGVGAGAARDIPAFQYQLKYNPAVFDVVSTSPGNVNGIIGQSLTPLGPIVNKVAGSILFGAYSPTLQANPANTAPKSGILTSITFKAKTGSSQPELFELSRLYKQPMFIGRDLSLYPISVGNNYVVVRGTTTVPSPTLAQPTTAPQPTPGPSQVNFSLSVDRQTLNPGDQVGMDIKINPQNVPVLGGMQVAILYNPLAFDLTAATLADLNNLMGRTVSPINPTNDLRLGVVRFGMLTFPQNPQTHPPTAGIIAHLTFRAKDAKGAYPFAVVEYITTDALGSTVNSNAGGPVNIAIGSQTGVPTPQPALPTSASARAATCRVTGPAAVTKGQNVTYSVESSQVVGGINLYYFLTDANAGWYKMFSTNNRNTNKATFPLYNVNTPVKVACTLGDNTIDPPVKQYCICSSTPISVGGGGQSCGSSCVLATNIVNPSPTSTPRPTATPTRVPSPTPTPRPTVVPTRIPTPSPTPRPTLPPTPTPNACQDIINSAKWLCYFTTPQIRSIYWNYYRYFFPSRAACISDAVVCQ